MASPGGVAGGVKAKSSKGTRPNTKQSSVPAFGLAMNQAPPTAAQQAGSARLFGAVSDASQARVPDATLVVSAKEGGIKEITTVRCRWRVRVSRPPFGPLLD